MHKSWMREAIRISHKSPCHRRKVGCCLVTKLGRIIVAYNTPLQPCKTCARVMYKSGEHLELCQAIHAEVACIAIAARDGISTHDSTLFTSSIIPCKNCMLALIHAGIETIYVSKMEEYDRYALKLANAAPIHIKEVKLDNDEEVMAGDIQP